MFVQVVHETAIELSSKFRESFHCIQRKKAPSFKRLIMDRQLKGAFNKEKALVGTYSECCENVRECFRHL